MDLSNINWKYLAGGVAIGTVIVIGIYIAMGDSSDFKSRYTFGFNETGVLSSKLPARIPGGPQSGWSIAGGP